MNRIITILVTIFILLLLYIWISHVWGSDTPKPKQIVDATEHELSDGLTADADTSVISQSYETTDEDPGQEDFKTERPAKMTEEKPVSAPETKTVTETKKEEPKNLKPATEEKPAATPSTPAATETKKVDTKPKSNPAPAKVVSSPVSAEGGKHLVIAGNFSQLANAQQRVGELKKAGFSDAEVVNFDISEYHTVCAGRFADVNEARKLVKKLKDYHKIDAYVRIGS